MAVLILVFTLLDVVPRLKLISVSQKFLPFLGLIRGFFGGLSGHQGALRSAFLIRSNLSAVEFVATGTIIAVRGDASRLIVYSKDILSSNPSLNWPVLTAAVLFAAAGAIAGARLIKKVTIESLQFFVGIALAILAVLLGAGIV